MDILDYLASDNYIIVNKELIRIFGLEEAVLLGELCREYRYWKREDRLENGMFYSTIDNIEENTGLTAHEQRQAIKSLENAKVLTTELKGIPAKRYFSLDNSTVVKILTSCSADFSQQEVKKVHSKNNKNNRLINNKSISKDIDTKSDDTITKKKPSLYDKCVVMINDFTSDDRLRDNLVSALKLFLDNSRESGTPFYSNTFKGKLNALKKLTDNIYEQDKIVQQTLDNGWNNFYALKSDKSKSKNVMRDIEHLTGGLNERASKKGDQYETAKF